MTIYVVKESNDHEVESILRAFKSRKKAEAYAKAVMDYNQTRPDAPSLKASNEAWEDFWAAEKEWGRLHPCIESQYADHIGAYKVELEGVE